MTTALPDKTTSSQAERTLLGVRSSTIRSWLGSWELYLIILVAGILRLYKLNTTEFDDDQASIYAMARHAVTHGYLVATSNVASVHIYNPPATIYFYMLPALLSSNPMWGAVLTGILMTLSVLLTYTLVRRAYGRLVGAIAALLYATASLAVFYSRFMWNQNLLPIVIVLFMMSLFWGVVHRRQGWLVFAIPLLGLLVQLHATGVLMAAPFALALVLAPKTIRLRDIALGLLLLLMLYAPYLYWEYSVKFADISILLNSMHRPSVIDNQAWLFYQRFLDSYPFNFNALPLSSHTSLLAQVYPSISWLEPTMISLAIGGAVLALIVALYPSGPRPTGQLSLRGIGPVVRYWTRLRGNSYRCGLLLLLVWQVIPLLYLSRHSLKIYVHYFIFFMPGQFILIAFLFGTLFKWLRAYSKARALVQLGSVLLVVLPLVLVITQSVGAGANVYDYTHGNFQDGSATGSLYTELQALQNATHQADSYAQAHHFNHIYMTATFPFQTSLGYLSMQMQTPTTLIESQFCLALPGAANGPALMLVSPYDSQVETLLTHDAHATLVAESPRSGSVPFKLYSIQPSTLQPVANKRFGNDLQLLNATTQPFSLNGRSYITTQWSMMRNAQARYNTLYGYHLTAFTGNMSQGTSQQCLFASMRAGDDVLVAFQQPGNAPANKTKPLQVQAQSYTVTPYYLTLGPLAFETYENITSPWEQIRTSRGGYTLTIA
jgi:4-amino-4-deoxy-L-arabinose transferase-like glycosyltransferase